MTEEPTISTETKAVPAPKANPSPSPARKASPAKGKQTKGKITAIAAKALPGKITLPTPPRAMAEALVQRLGRSQALRTQQALGAVLKKLADKQQKAKPKDQAAK